MLHLHPELVDMSRAEEKELRQPMEGLETKSYGVH
jgi:creatinine amidohydrolase/Fe(II)-dependent formamide hydrolase-like protein